VGYRFSDSIYSDPGDQSHPKQQHSGVVVTSEASGTSEAGGKTAATRVKPIFIVGVPRSGTTLLVNLVGMHPQLAPVFETRFLRNLLRHCDYASRHWNRARTPWFGTFIAEHWLRSRFTARCKAYRAKVLSYHTPGRNFSNGRENEVPFDRQLILYTRDELVEETDRWIGRLTSGTASETEVYSGARELVSNLFSRHCARMDKAYWVNKTPGLLTELRHLPKLFPDAKCLHIIRDGRDVAISTVSMTWGPTTVTEAARRWKDLLRAGRKQVDHERLDYMELRYEDLVHTPRNIVRDLFAFLELDTDLEQILSPIKVYPDSVGVWKIKWGRDERKAFADAAGDLLIELGYERDYRWVD
jgi:hypothetical protein